MSDTDLKMEAPDLPEEAPPRASRRIRAILADTYSFIRSAESNQAFSTVTFAQLVTDQIKRNGESAASSKSQYDPYNFDPDSKKPSGQEPPERTNFIGGSDTGAPTRMERLLALKNALADTVDQIKEVEPLDVATEGEYADAELKPSGSEEEEL